MSAQIKITALYLGLPPAHTVTNSKATGLRLRLKGQCINLFNIRQKELLSGIVGFSEVSCYVTAAREE